MVVIETIGQVGIRVSVACQIVGHCGAVAIKIVGVGAIGEVGLDEPCFLVCQPLP